MSDIKSRKSVGPLHQRPESFPLGLNVRLQAASLTESLIPVKKPTGLA
jgi:hypothetical protein